MSWWKKALRAVGLGAGVYGEFRAAKDPNSRTAQAIKTGGEILAHEMTEDTKDEPPKEPKIEHPLD